MPKSVDLIGRKFGQLTVISRVGSVPYRGVAWLVRCDCGAEKILLSTKLTTRHQSSCGSAICRNLASNLLGQRFNRLLVIERLPNNKHRQTCWLCKCDCGNTTTATITDLQFARVKSCGCLQDEVNHSVKKHGRCTKDKRERLSDDFCDYNLFIGARWRAKKKSLPFNLDIEDIHIPGRCPVVNHIILKRGPGKLCNASPTVDRVIPALGYVRGNVRVISALANRLKSNATAEQLLAIGFDMIKHTKGQYCGR
jgi:hypothetical protein